MITLITLCVMLVLLTATLVLSALDVIAFNSNSAYVKRYKPQTWKLWEDFIEVASRTKNIKIHTYHKNGCVECHLTDTNGNPRYIIALWIQRKASIHNMDTTCVLSTFDEKHSKKMFNVLYEKLPEELKLIFPSDAKKSD